jgi:hypothetical protein
MPGHLSIIGILASFSIALSQLTFQVLSTASWLLVTQVRISRAKDVGSTWHHSMVTCTIYQQVPFSLHTCWPWEKFVAAAEHIAV